MTRRTLPLLAALALTVAATACGNDDGNAVTSPDATQAPGSSAATETAFPVTITHKYGETTVDAEPLRVVSVGFSDQDFILALGVTPIAIRDWYGDQPFATWPWAQDELGDAEPAVLSSLALNFEEIAALQPDLIVGVSSGMTDEEYATLSAIAPTIAQPGDYIDYGTPWDVATQLIGDALGKSAEAAAIVAETKQLFTDARAEHPEFEGATAGVTFLFDGAPGAYSSSDSRSRLLTDLGFQIPAEFDELSGDSFYFTVSQEDLSVLDTDVVLWIVGDESGVAEVAAMPLRPTMTAFAEGREIITDAELSGAFSFASPLSLEYVVEALVPELALAVDGDPSTPVPSAERIGGEAAQASGAELDAEQQAAADAWSAVFDSTVAFADKAAHIENAADLQATVERYTAAGHAMGGIALAPTAVVIDGETATITYDVLFGGTPAYTDQTGTITLVDGVWVVGTGEFCGFMASARNPCP